MTTQSTIQRFLAGALVAILLPVFFGCDNPVNTDKQDDTDDTVISDLDVSYFTAPPDISPYLGWIWSKKGTDFKWTFKTDGTMTVAHCCGLTVGNQFSYLVCGNIFVTYGSEMGADKLEKTTFTITETEYGVTFARSNGINFTHSPNDKDADFHAGHGGSDHDSGLVLVLSNDLLGTWRTADGSAYTFKTDSRLQISPPAANAGDYGYLVRKNKLVTLGPLVEGTQPVMTEYAFTRKGDSLALFRSGKQTTLSFVE
jgi:hypothetical protein